MSRESSTSPGIGPAGKTHGSFGGRSVIGLCRTGGTWQTRPMASRSFQLAAPTGRGSSGSAATSASAASRALPVNELVQRHAVIMSRYYHDVGDSHSG